MPTKSKRNGQSSVGVLLLGRVGDTRSIISSEEFLLSVLFVLTELMSSPSLSIGPSPIESLEVVLLTPSFLRRLASLSRGLSLGGLENWSAVLLSLLEMWSTPR